MKLWKHSRPPWPTLLAALSGWLPGLDLLARSRSDLYPEARPRDASAALLSFCFLFRKSTASFFTILLAHFQAKSDDFLIDGIARETADDVFPPRILRFSLRPKHRLD